MPPYQRQLNTPQYAREPPESPEIKLRHGLACMAAVMIIMFVNFLLNRHESKKREFLAARDAREAEEAKFKEAKEAKGTSGKRGKGGKGGKSRESS